MNFKNWLILNEEETKCMLCGFVNPSGTKECLACGDNIKYKYKNIVQGPILLYHGTSTGEDNKTLNSFKNEGAKPIGGGYGQGGGLYVMSLKKDPYNHAISVTSNKIGSNVKHAGLPMVVSIEFPFIDTKEWDLDQEIHGGEIIEFIKKFIRINKMNQISKGIAPTNILKVNTSLSPKDQSMLDKDTPDISSKYYSDAISTRNKDVNIKWNPTFKSMQLLDKDFRQLDPPTFSDNKKGYDDEGGHHKGTGGVLSPMYLKHQMQNPEFHHALEAKFIQDKIKNNKGLAIKYVGDQTFPVKSIEVFKDGQWVTV